MSTLGRDEAIAYLSAGHVSLAALIDRLDDASLARPATIGGGDWSAKDLMGHIAFWEELAFQSLAAWRERRTPPTDADDWPGVDAANARNQERTTRASLGEIRQRADLAQLNVIAALQSVTAEEWTAEPFYPGARHPTLGDLLGGVLGGSQGPFKHIEDHLPDLERYVAG